MKSYRAPLIICLLALALAAPLAAVPGSWSSLGPDGGPVFSLASLPDNPQVIYAGVFAGVYKSVDGGTTWVWAGRGLDARFPVLNLTIDPSRPSTLYAGQTAGLYKSVNGGATWTRTGLSPNLTIYDFAIHPRFPQTLFAATHTGLFTSANGGGKWKRITRGLPSLPHASLAVVIDPSTPRRMFVSIDKQPRQQAGVFKSLDGGFSWQPVRDRTLEAVLPMRIDPRSPRVLYASTVEGLFRTTNDGDSCTRVTDQMTTLAFPARQKNVLYAGNNANIFRSLDNGSTWSQISQGLSPIIVINGLLAFPTQPETLYFASFNPAHQAGVYKSTDGGISWMRSNRGLIASNINSFVVDPHDSDTLWAVANYALVKSVDRGHTWNVALSDMVDSARWVVVSPADPQTVYLGRWDGQILRSRDGGESWTAAGDPASSTEVLKADPRDPLTLWATGNTGGIRRSTDGGDTWNTLSGPASGGFYQDIAFAPSSPSTVYAAGNAFFNVILRSTDAGSTWTALQNGLPPSLGNLAIDPLQAGTVYTVATSGDVYKTVDGGSTWNLASNVFHGLTVQWLTVAPSGSIYAALRYDTVYVSENGGQTWSRLGVSPDPLSFTTLTADPDDDCRVYAGTHDRGLRAFTRTGTTTCP
jgi:photosystem II stability/assembly factor-like uncharacterized protein